MCNDTKSEQRFYIIKVKKKIKVASLTSQTVAPTGGHTVEERLIKNITGSSPGGQTVWYEVYKFFFFTFNDKI